MFGRKKKKQEELEQKAVASEIAGLLMNPKLPAAMEEATRLMDEGRPRSEVEEVIRRARDEGRS